MNDWAQQPTGTEAAVPQWAQQRIDKVRQKGLTKLDLRGWDKDEKLTAVPETIFHLTNLQDLNLSFNKLTAVPEAIAKLTNLQVLNLSFNKLTAVPETIAQLTDLQVLHLGNNHLTAIPEAIAQLTNLQMLNLHRNQLTTVPEAIAQLTSLQRLDLSSNKLMAIPEAIALPINLQELDLRNDGLTAVPETIAQLTNLQELYLSLNQITAVPHWLIDLPKLVSLHLGNNPIVTPPLEVLQLGMFGEVDLAALRAFFRQAAQAARLYEAKLLIVGEPGAGKTSLTRKLLNPAAALPTKDESTEGIDVHTWTFPLSEDGGRLSVIGDRLSVTGGRLSGDDDPVAAANPQFRVNIWDFGGQAIYHATHQFFLSRRSLYVVVADAREQKTDFYHWLDLIEHLSDRSPVFIFNNEIQNRHWAINEQQLQAHFPDTFQAPFAFNLAEDPLRLDDLRRKIQQQISQLPHVGDELPHTWVNVRRALETDDRATVTQSAFLQLCTDNGFTRREDALQLSGYLHDLGVILHFQDDPLLKKTVILKPEWGTDAAYGVLDDPGVAENNGRFARTDLQTIWQGEDYADLHDELLALMMKFQLCYEIPGRGGQYIAPQLLGEQPPDYELTAASESLYLRYKYEAFMPKGLLSRFIVVLHQHIAGNGQWVWRTGVVLEKDGAQAEVVEYYHRREIRIRVTGKNRKELLTIISYELDKLHAPFHRLKFDKLVPCHCATCQAEDEPHFYRLEILKTRLEHDKDVIECDKPPFATVQIRPLLDDMGLAVLSIDRRELLRRLEASYNEEEARTLCFQFGMEYDDLGGRGRSGNLRELVAYAERYGRLWELANLMRKQR